MDILAVPTHREAARDIPVMAEVDVLVIGAGPAGVGAALAAARAGAKTLLVEKSSSLGGTWTIGLQTHATCFNDQQGRVIVSGIALELMRRLHAIGAAEDPFEKAKKDPKNWFVAFHPDSMRCTLDEMMREAGVRVLLHGFCAGAMMEGSRLAGAIVETKSGRMALRAKLTVDCSGDGDVVHFAGAEYEKGRPADGRNQPGTTAFMMHGANLDKARQWAKDNQALYRQLQAEARARGELPTADLVEYVRIGAPGVPADLTYHNITRIPVDSTDAWSLSNAEMEGRRQVSQIIAFYRRHVPGFEESAVYAIAPQLGLRESRRLVGLYKLTADDVLKASRFEDAIARHNYYIDIHAAEMGLDDRSGLDMVISPGQYYEVPYRCLVPVHVDQLLVAGRCISASREGLGSARTTVCCCELGQAAGTAAAMAASRGCLARQVDGRELSKRVLADFPNE